MQKADSCIHLTIIKVNLAIHHLAKSDIENKPTYISDWQVFFSFKVFIDRFRYNANRASQVQSKLKILEKL
jgi:hypothetical protein